MYIISEGLVYVYVRFKERKESVKVAQLTSGQFFGEMSLLTGESRAATVVAATDVLLYEITKKDFAELLKNRPEIAAKISEIITRHQQTTLKARERLISEVQENEMENRTTQLLGKIKNFFGIK
jgi:CRP-like cAMP-binding protein